MLSINPDAIIVKVGGDGRKKGDGGSGGTNACYLARAKLSEDFGASHER
jgi:hypothetical protein